MEHTDIRDGEVYCPWVCKRTRIVRLPREDVCAGCDRTIVDPEEHDLTLREEMEGEERVVGRS